MVIITERSALGKAGKVFYALQGLGTCAEGRAPATLYRSAGGVGLCVRKGALPSAAMEAPARGHAKHIQTDTGFAPCRRQRAGSDENAMHA